LQNTEFSGSLRRVIGVGGLTLLAINQIVGSGIFGLPGLAAELLGPAAILAYLIVGVLMLLVGLCFAEVGSRVAGAGGLYAYAHAAFGPVVGGIAGTLIWAASSAVSFAQSGKGSKAAVYITAEEVNTVNKQPGTDRTIKVVDIGSENFSTSSPRPGFARQKLTRMMPEVARTVLPPWAIE